MISKFAEQRHLKVRDDCGEVIVPGKQGQIYEYDSESLGVMFMPATKQDKWGKWCPKRWGNFRRAGQALGMVVRQNGDSEGCLSINPANKAQARLAIKMAGVRPKRQISEARRAALVARLNRSKTPVEATLAF